MCPRMTLWKNLPPPIVGRELHEYDGSPVKPGDTFTILAVYDDGRIEFNAWCPVVRTRAEGTEFKIMMFGNITPREGYK